MASKYGHREWGQRFPSAPKYQMHKGVDFAAKTGTPVRALAAGTVKSFRSPLAGAIDIDTISYKPGVALRLVYGHLSKIVVKPGDKVKLGDIIGYVGNINTRVESHLHLGAQLYYYDIEEFVSADPATIFNFCKYEYRHLSYIR